MEAYGLEPQVVLTTPLINSWDGSKMSGSKGNYIALVEDPNDQFGKTMRLPDEMLDEYFRLVAETEDRSDDPFQAKLALARFVVGRAHGDEAAQAAEGTSPASSGRGSRRRRSRSLNFRTPTPCTCRGSSSTGSTSARRARHGD